MTDNTTRVIKLINGERISFVLVFLQGQMKHLRLYISHPLKMELKNRITKKEHALKH